MDKRFNKKGQGEFVAYVLLIGLAVTLAVLVGRWSIEQAQKSSENVVRQSSIEDKCNEIAIGGSVDKSSCPGTQPSIITITNRGNLKIPNIRIRGEDNKNCGFPDDQLVNLKPGKSVTKTLNIECTTAIILPLVNIGDEESIGCTEKRLMLKLSC